MRLALPHGLPQLPLQYSRAANIVQLRFAAAAQPTRRPPVRPSRIARSPLCILFLATRSFRLSSLCARGVYCYRSEGKPSSVNVLSARASVVQ